MYHIISYRPVQQACHVYVSPCLFWAVQVCGGINALVAACDAAPGCVAFDMEDSNSCGYLKTGSAGTYTEGTNSYTKA
jgi:hypothetical protein